MIEPHNQGDSLWVDYTVEGWEQAYATWGATWTGIFEISASESSTPLYTGTLTRSTTSGIFQLRLNYDSASTAPILAWSALAVGTYLLMAQVTESTSKFRKEYFETLIIRTQGL